MRKLLFALFAVMLSILAVPAFADGIKWECEKPGGLCPSVTNVPPLSEKLIAVAHFPAIQHGAHGTDPYVTTLGSLTANRPTILDATNGEMKICTVESMEHPVMSADPICVSAWHLSEFVWAARFSVSSLATPATQPQFVSRTRFFRGNNVALPPKGVTSLYCLVDANGKNKNVCRPTGWDTQ